MLPMRSNKYLTYQLLQKLNAEAVANGYNRSLFFERLPIAQTDLFPVALAMPHNDVEMRCQLVLNKHGETAWLDMTLRNYDRLPSVDCAEVEAIEA